MPNVVTGVIQQINAKPVSGGKTAYDIIVAGEKYGYGLYPPKASEGDYVRFEVDESRGYKNVARNSLKVSKNKPPAEAVAAAAAPVKAAFDNRQDTISRQAAYNTAVAWLALLQNAGALSPPSAKGKAQEYMDTMLAETVRRFYEANTGQAWTDISPKAAKAEAPSEDEPPFEDDAAPADSEWE